MTEKPPARMRAVGFSVFGALVLVCAFARTANAAPQDAGAKSSTVPTKNAKKTGAIHRKSTTHPPSASHSTSGKSSTTAHRVAGKRKRGSTKRVRGQQKIDSERAQSIQEALIREHYLTGEPTGTWNQASEDAMRKYQADHGWQSKQVPDSRALIKLGLGPSKEHLLNPESAMTTVPDSPRAESLNPVSHSADPGPASTQQSTSPESSGPQ